MPTLYLNPSAIHGNKTCRCGASGPVKNVNKYID